MHAGGASATPAQAAPRKRRSTRPAHLAPRPRPSATRPCSGRSRTGPRPTRSRPCRASRRAAHGGEGKAAQIFLRGFDADHEQDVEVRVGGLPVNGCRTCTGRGTPTSTSSPPKRSGASPCSRAVRPTSGDFAVAGSVSFDLGLAEPGVVARAAPAPSAPAGSSRATGRSARTPGRSSRSSISRRRASGRAGRRIGRRASRRRPSTSAIVELRVLAGLYAADSRVRGRCSRSAREAGAWTASRPSIRRQGGASHRAFALAELHARTARSVVLRAVGVREGHEPPAEFHGELPRADGARRGRRRGRRADRNRLADERGAVGSARSTVAASPRWRTPRPSSASTAASSG